MTSHSQQGELKYHSDGCNGSTIETLLNECPSNDKSNDEATARMKVTMQRITMLHHEVISEQQDSTACYDHVIKGTYTVY